MNDLIQPRQSTDVAALGQAADAMTRARGQDAFLAVLRDARRSLLASAALIDDLCHSGAEPDAIREATRMARTLARHVDLCARAVEQLGGVVTDELVPGRAIDHGGWPASARVVRRVIELLCVESTLCASTLAAMRRAARDPIARELLGDMLLDQRAHTALGWSWLERDARHLPCGMRDWVMDWLPELLADVEARCRPPLSAVTRVQLEPPCPFGGLSAAEREVSFLRAMHERILPGLRQAGLDGTAAWSMRPERDAA